MLRFPVRLIEAMRTVSAVLLAVLLLVQPARAQCTPQWQPFGAGMSDWVFDLTTWDPYGAVPLPAQLVARGGFTTDGAVTANRIARWTSNPACYANCDGSTGTPVLTPADFVCFLNAFRSGCP